MWAKRPHAEHDAENPVQAGDLRVTLDQEKQNILHVLSKCIRG